MNSLFIVTLVAFFYVVMVLAVVRFVQESSKDEE